MLYNTIFFDVTSKIDANFTADLKKSQSSSISYF